MSKAHPQDSQIQKLVTQFCEHVFQLKLVHHIYRELYEDDHSQYLMEKVAHHFFYDIGNVLIDYLLLEVAKLSDPAQDARGTRENFTIRNLLDTIEWPDAHLQKLLSTTQS